MPWMHARFRGKCENQECTNNQGRIEEGDSIFYTEGCTYCSECGELAEEDLKDSDEDDEDPDDDEEDPALVY
jgi:hypothetical protein